MKLIFNKTHPINLWFYKVYCRRTIQDIEETKEYKNHNIIKNVYDLNYIPTFSYNKLDYKIIKSVERDRLADILAGSFLIYLPRNSPLIVDIISYITKWSLINRVKTIYFINNYPDIIKFDGRLKNVSYEIAKSLNVNIPFIYLISNRVQEVIKYINVSNLKKYVIKPNFGDTGYLVLINSLNKIDEYRYFPKYSQKELLPLLKKEDAKIILQEYIKSNIEVKLYIFQGKIRFIQVNKDMCSPSGNVYDKKCFMNAEFKYNGYVEIPFLEELKKDAIKLFKNFKNYYKNDIFTYFLRVDFLVNSNNYYFNEFSLLPKGGKGRGMTEKCDLYWGDLFLKTTTYLSLLK